MALIGEIAVNIVAKTGAFTKGMNAVRKNLKTVGTQFAKFGGVVAGGLLAAAKTFSNFGDEVAKMSKRVGVGVETLSALEFAAAQSGSSLQSVEKGIRGMSRSILDGSRGSAEIVFAFDKLGLSISELQGMSPDRQFMAIAMALSSIEDPTLKAGLAMKVLGRSGTELIPLFNEGKTGIAALIREAEELGIVLSAKDAAAAEQLNDAFGRLGFQFKAIIKEFAVAVSGPLLDFLDQLKEIGKTTIQFIRANQATVIWLGKVGATATIVGASMLAMSKIVGIATVAIKGLTAAIIFLSSHPLAALITLIGIGAVIAIDKLTGASKKLTDWMMDVGNAADTTAGKLQNVATAATDAAAAAQKTAEIRAFGRPLPVGDDLRTLRNERMAAVIRLREREAFQNQAPFVGREFTADTERARNFIAALEERIAALATKQTKPPAFIAEIGFTIKRGIIDAVDAVAGGRLGGGLLQSPIFGRITSVFTALEDFRKAAEETPQEIVRNANSILQKGSQEAIAFAAQHRQRQTQTPEKKIEKNTAETVKAVNSVKAAINKLAEGFGREQVFTIPAS